MRWAGHVACMGRREVYAGFRVETEEELGIGDSITLKWILKNRMKCDLLYSSGPHSVKWEARVNTVMNRSVL
jgi:hypothetical protein